MSRHALITGGSRGIGLAIARLLAHNNYSITMVARTSSALHSAISSLPSPSSSLPHHTIAGDTSQPDFWETVTSEGQLKGRERIDVLVNCAGISQNSLFVRTSAEDVQDIVRTNLTGMMLGTRCLVKKKLVGKKQNMTGHDEMNGAASPVIINISSLLGVRGGRGAVAYAASKAGVLGFTRALAAEVGPVGIRVNAIVPGYISTDMTKDLPEYPHLINQIPLKRFGTPDEVADAALFLIKNQYANNCVINLDGGLSAT